MFAYAVWRTIVDDLVSTNLNPLINSNKFSEDQFRFSTHIIILFANDDGIISTFSFFFYPVAMARTSNSVFNRNGDIRYSVPDTNLFF